MKCVNQKIFFEIEHVCVLTMQNSYAEQTNYLNQFKKAF
jgi:hypothetical protein